ncbi:MAG: DUF1538 domain-containing protein [Candidatus Methanomethylophilaceae archaeon]|nr:DUF1538 domain-containing protein [Candidatus Methanomethylophilaceae archaeon]
MLEGVRKEFKEVLGATTPVILFILATLVLVMGAETETIILFISSSIMLVIGFTLFLLGVKLGMLPVGESIGSELPQHRSLFFILGVAFLLSLLVTMAEPDVRVLANLFDNVSGGSLDNNILVVVIAIGVAFFIVISILRILLGVPIKWILGIGYLSIILLSFLTPAEFLAISFDSGGVTTGPMTVPVILSLGTGITSVLSNRKSISDSFGLIGLASIGPILTMMLLGVLLG